MNIRKILESNINVKSHHQRGPARATSSTKLKGSLLGELVVEIPIGIICEVKFSVWCKCWWNKKIQNVFFLSSLYMINKVYLLIFDMFIRSYAARVIFTQSIRFWQHYTVLIPLTLLLVTLTFRLGVTQGFDCMDCAWVMRGQTCAALVPPNCETGREICGCCDLCRLTEGESCNYRGPPWVFFIIILYSQCRGWWWPGDARSQGISNPEIDVVLNVKG